MILTSRTALTWIVLIAAVIFFGCRANQKDDVRELEAREAQSASAATKQARQEFESDVEGKLSNLRFRIDEARARIPTGNQVLANEISQQLSQLDQDLLSIRMQFDQLKTGSDEQFNAGKQALRARVDEFQQTYMRYATGRPR